MSKHTFDSPVDIFFKRMAIIYSILLLTFILFFIFFINGNNLTSNKQNFIFIIFILVIIVCLIICGFGWYGFLESKNEIKKFQLRFEHWIKLPGFANVILFFMIQILLGSLFTLIQIRTKLFSPEYINEILLLVIIFLLIFPFFLFGICLIRQSLIKFCYFSKSTLRHILLGIISMICFVLIPLILDNLFPTLLQNLEVTLSSELISSVFFFVVIPIILFDLILTISLLISLKTNQPGQIIKPKKVDTDQNKIIIDKKSWAKIYKRPSLASLLIAIIFFVLFLSLIRMGYDTNDDIAIISIVSGYSGTSSEFLVKSNVLLGLFLKPLYQLHTTINFEILFFVVIDFLSTWAIIYEIILLKIKRIYKIIFIITVCVFNSYYLANITYTLIAANAAIAGFILLVSKTQKEKNIEKIPIVCGISLIFVSYLIRINATLMVGIMFIPLIIINLNFFYIQKLILVFLATMSLIVSGYIFDRVYVKANLYWDNFYTFDSIRDKIMDTPRLTNAKEVMNAIHWTENDYVLISNWFFPDKEAFSLGNLQYLVEHSSSIRNETVEYFYEKIFKKSIFPYLLLLVSIIICVLQNRNNNKIIYFTSIILLILPFVIFFVFAWWMKLVNRVILPPLAASCFLEFFLCGWFNHSTQNSAKVFPKRGISFWFGWMTLFFSLVVSLGLIINQLVDTSNYNKRRQMAYQVILTRLDELVKTGTIQKDALIVGTAVGIPVDWANPWYLNYPRLNYQFMGWLTFSPIYENNLSQYGIKSLARAFYEKNNIYLTTQPDLVPFIVKFIEERENVNIVANQIALLPGTDTWLYRFNKSH